jgi:hypothetical protein
MSMSRLTAGVNCALPYRADSFTCQVKDRQGETRNAQVTVKDEQGNINVKL